MAEAGIASRRRAEEIISQGRVKVNGKVICKQGFKVSTDDRIEVDGRPIKREKRVYLLLYKPVGFITTVDDPQGRKTVLDLIKGITGRIYPVGRLDYNTSGLLLMTNDGELTFKLTHPSFLIDKTYQVMVKGYPKRSDFQKLEKGIYLEDGLTAPARVSKIVRLKDKTVFNLSIHEGRNRQVRRMCQSFGFPVEKLQRIRYAFLDLDGLQEGEYRFLTSAEVNKLKKNLPSG